MTFDPVQRPRHYIAELETNCPECSQRIKVEVECRQLAKERGFLHEADIYNAFKYLFRCNFKEKRVQDIEKAVKYLDWWLGERGEEHKKDNK